MSDEIEFYTRITQARVQDNTWLIYIYYRRKGESKWHEMNPRDFPLQSVPADVTDAFQKRLKY